MYLGRYPTITDKWGKFVYCFSKKKICRAEILPLPKKIKWVIHWFSLDIKFEKTRGGDSSVGKLSASHAGVWIQLGAWLGSPNAWMTGGEITSCKKHKTSVSLTDWCIMIFVLKKEKKKFEMTELFCHTYMRFRIRSFVITCTVSLEFFFPLLFFERFALRSLACSSIPGSPGCHFSSSISPRFVSLCGTPKSDSSTCDVCATL